MGTNRRYWLKHMKKVSGKKSNRCYSMQSLLSVKKSEAVLITICLHLRKEYGTMKSNFLLQIYTMCEISLDCDPI
jgi:hypothetical protein